MKADIQRVESIITNNHNTHVSEHKALLLLLNTIQDYVYKINMNAESLEEKIHVLSDKVNTQESINKTKCNIELLFNVVYKPTDSTTTTPTLTTTTAVSLAICNTATMIKTYRLCYTLAWVYL